MDATKGKSNAAIMKQIIKDATKGLKGEEKEKAIRDLFVKVMPKPKAVTGKKIRTVKKITAAGYMKKFKSILRTMKVMFNDRIEHADSNSPMSAKKILDTIIMLQQAERRIK